jgi:hypothetical protein
MCKIIKDHPGTVFTRIAGPTTARISDLEALTNLQHEDLVRFQNRINTKTDL